MSTNGDRRRRERRARLEQFIEETEEELDSETDTGTIEDLLIEDTFATESGTLSIADEDLPIETGANPLPSPWQGIRRVGMVLNFGFVWDATAEQWERQTPDTSSGGSSGGGLSTGEAVGSRSQLGTSDNVLNPATSEHPTSNTGVANRVVSVTIVKDANAGAEIEWPNGTFNRWESGESLIELQPDRVLLDAGETFTVKIYSNDGATANGEINSLCIQ